MQGRPYQEFALGVPSPPLPFLFPFPSSLLPFPSLPSFSLPSPLDVGPVKPAKGSGERCKLPQRGPGQSPGQKIIWCTLKL